MKQKGYPPAKVGQGCLEHKHMPQRAVDSTAIDSMDSTVAILVVRNVADWLAGTARAELARGVVSEEVEALSADLRGPWHHHPDPEPDLPSPLPVIESQSPPDIL